MRHVTILIQGLSEYSQSKPHREEKLNKEGADEYEKRTWINRLHVNDAGEVILPPMALKNCLAEAAKFLGKQIPGKGKSTYTKHFESGLLVFHKPNILDGNDRPILKEDCDKEGSWLYGDWIFTPSDGIAGSGKRVYRCYPVIKTGWRSTAKLAITDHTITKSVLEEHLEAAGMLIGIGRWRVRNRGLHGQFSAKVIDWSEAH